MKTIFTLASLLSLVISSSTAQVSWCIPSVVPYGPTTPGITEFKLNSIDRISDDLESMQSNYELTDKSTTLIRGQSYSISIKHTADASICPDMNLRVWIDFNLNGDLDDNGELVLSVDHHTPGTYTANFTVPLTAAIGQTRLRATAKMSNLGGHTPPTPCNIPPDPLGYHGEVEDYNITIESNTAVEEVNNEPMFFIFPNPATDMLNIQLPKSDGVRTGYIELLNAAGERVDAMQANLASSQQGICAMHLANLPSGNYFIRVTANGVSAVKPFLIEAK